MFCDCPKHPDFYKLDGAWDKVGAFYPTKEKEVINA